MSQYPLRRARGYRIAAAAVVALVMAGLFAGVLYGSWGSVSRQAAAAATERQGLGQLQAGIRLLAALRAGESAAADGRTVDTAAITVAETEVASVTAGTPPGVAGRWQDLQARIGGLLRKPATIGDQGWADAVGLCDDLIDAIADAASVAVDPDVATNSLLDAIVGPLPATIMYAARAIVPRVPGTRTTVSGFSANQAQYQVALAAADVNADLRAGVTGDLGDGDTIGSAEDSFTAAVSAFTSPSSVDPVTSSTDGVTVAMATAVQTAALNLATALIGRTELLVAARQDKLQGDQLRYLGATIGLVLCALALLWLLTPARNQGGELEAVSDEAPPVAPGTVDPTALIDARDLLLEELVHIGRGVRTPTRGSDDDAQ
jgi:hypothetical protein